MFCRAIASGRKGSLMGGVQTTTDQWVFWRWEAWPAIKLNATILFSWGVMGLLVLMSWLVTRRLSTDIEIPRFQNALEVLLEGILDQIRKVSGQDQASICPLLARRSCSLAQPTYSAQCQRSRPPTGSLSTTAASATYVFVPLYGIATQGVFGYLRHHIRPTLFMLPFNVIGKLSRTLALGLEQHGVSNPAYFAAASMPSNVRITSKVGRILPTTSASSGYRSAYSWMLGCSPRLTRSR